MMAGIPSAERTVVRVTWGSGDEAKAGVPGKEK